MPRVILALYGLLLLAMVLAVIFENVDAPQLLPQLLAAMEIGR